MSSLKWSVAAVAVILLAAVLWSSLGTRDDQQLADAIARRQQSAPVQTLASDPDQLSDVTRLTDRVIVDAGRIQDAWVVQLHDRLRPRIKLPAKPTMQGDLEDAQVVTDPVAREPDPGFVGAAACAECHQTRFDGFSKTAHHQTSKPASVDAVMGPLQPPDNRLSTKDSELSFIMSRDDDQLQQVIQLADWQCRVPMDVVVGSGKLGQTFLYWHGDALFQSHVSYFPGSERWVASPGFNEVDANYARPMRSECLECHVTYIAEKKRPNHFYRDSVVWGISCERCHGPGKQHVQYHAANPKQTEAAHIANPSELTRQQQLDLCGQCHSGEFKFLDKPFRFRPGDAVDRFHRLLHPDSDQPGVHTSNQLTRLKRSECFKHSEMTCTTCHNPHRLQRGDTLAFSQACLECHQVEQCGVPRDANVQLEHDCITCHMPSSRNVDMEEMISKGLEVKSVDHHIRVVDQTREH